MYRKASGSTGVSWTRFINNAVPSMMVDSTKDPGSISMPRKDLFYSNQIQLSNPYGLVPASLHFSGILDGERISRKIYQNLQKCGVVSETDGTIDTNKIDKDFTHHLAAVSATRQKQIVNLFFWWEEECMRLRKLQGEKEELEGFVAGASGQLLETYLLLLKRVEGKIAARPSERIDELERDEDECMVRFRAGSALPLESLQSPSEAPPAYSSH